MARINLIILWVPFQKLPTHSVIKYHFFSAHEKESIMHHLHLQFCTAQINDVAQIRVHLLLVANGPHNRKSNPSFVSTPNFFGHKAFGPAAHFYHCLHIIISATNRHKILARCFHLRARFSLCACFRLHAGFHLTDYRQRYLYWWLQRRRRRRRSWWRRGRHR